MVSRFSVRSLAPSGLVVDSVARMLSLNDTAMVVNGRGGMRSRRVVETELDRRPMCTAATRAQHRRDELRFASELMDAEWAVIEPPLPSGSPLGRRPSWPPREIINAIFYAL